MQPYPAHTYLFSEPLDPNGPRREELKELFGVADKPSGCLSLVVPLLAAAGIADTRTLEDKLKTQHPSFIGVLQANRTLFDPEGPYAAPAILIYSPDPEVGTDPQEMSDLLRRAAACLDGEGPTTQAVGVFRAKVSDESGEYSHERLPESVTLGVQAYWSVSMLTRRELPGGTIPAHRLLIGTIDLETGLTGLMTFAA